MAGVAWLLAPRGTPARYVAPLLLIPIFTVRPAGPAEGAVWVTFLDVGQGLAALVRTSRHALLYDAGPAYSLEADAGNRVVVPYLRGEGVARLDVMMVTHNDNDHAGGAASVTRVIPTNTLWSSLGPSHDVHAYVPVRLPCRAGVQWRWDDVVFELLHPPVTSYDNSALRPNARSCVLRVASAHGAVLLTGDIEAREEKALLRRNASLGATALLAPHHGSGTSSTAGFLAAVKPAHAIFAVGYRNRFGHPKGDVLARYNAAGATIWRTDRDGAVTVKLTARGATIVRFRGEQPRYWH